MPDSFAESADGVILVANGIDPVVRWDGYSPQATLAGVTPPPDDVTPVLTGTGSGAITGTYIGYQRFVDRNGNVSNLSPASAEVTVTAAGGIVYSNLAVPVQETVARRQLLRNTDGQADVFYVDVDTTDLSSTSFTGTSTDNQLAAGEAVPLLDEDGLLFASRHNPPPDTKPFLSYHLNSMWAAGLTTYAEGSLRVTRASATVTGVATEWKRNWGGRFLYVQGATRSYEIDSVDPDAQTLTLVEPYADDTNAFAVYAIKPSPGEGATLAFSEPGLPESWPPVNAFTLPEDGDVVTGLLTFGSFLWILKRKRMYRMSAQSNPRKDGFIFFALGRGCVNHRCWVIVEEQLYMLDEGGVYRTGGGDQAEQLSTPIQNLFRRDEPGGINWTAGRYFHCSYDPAGETIRWFVTFKGEYLPRHALCLHYKSGKWWQEEYPVAVSSSCVGRAGRPTGGWGDDGEQVYLGGPAGSILSLGGPLDGAATQGHTVRGSVTAAGIDTLTDSRAAFSPAWVNLPVCITEGRGAGQLGLIVAATATELTVAEAWPVTPDATSRYQVGGIRYRYTGPRMRYGSADEAQNGASVELQFVPTEAPQVANLRLYQDFSVAPRKMGRPTGPAQRPGATTVKGGGEYVVQMDAACGHFWQRFDNTRERSVNAPRLVKVQVEGVSGPDPVVFGQMVLNGLVQ